ncbi:hypothetical protein CGZ94_02050 [Enemella evansiae]|uniref:Uncharacterized protein n=1 Tax=Enemella evansiae TaxID=2016499 RepID=A0A255GQL1_9ACTN|nr:hypothetical protein [Enemella evansiae]OYO17692.1 hypothetical protein CGZ94_02050 [Enemella evansiae]
MPITNRTVHPLDARRSVRDWLISPAYAAEADLGADLSAAGDPFDVDGELSHTDTRWVLTNGPDVTPLKEKLLPTQRITAPPVGEVVEGGAFTLTAGGAEQVGQWHRVHTNADGLLDWSEFCYTPQWRYATAATLLEVDQADRRTIEVAATGPFTLWLDGKELLSSNEVRYMEPGVHRVEVWLPSGTSTLVLAGWQVAFREVRQVYRVRVLGLPVRVVIPSPGADEDVARGSELLLNAVGSARWGSDTGELLLTGPRGLTVEATVADVTRRVELSEKPVAVDFTAEEDADDEDDLSSGGTGASMLSRPYDEASIAVADQPTSPIRRLLPFARLPRDYRGTPIGEPAEWHREFLEHALTIGGTAAALAAHTLQSTSAERARNERVEATEPVVTAERVQKALWMIDHRADCADFEAVGLAHLLHRVPAEQWADGVREQVTESLLGFKFWIDQPGLDAMCYFTENHQFVWHTAEYLIGTLFADQRFTNSGWTGAEHAAHGRKLLLEWLGVRLPGGFAEFDSNAYLAIDCFAAISLVELAEDEELGRLATALADRILLSLASNSWRGVHGAAHGRSYVQTQRSSRLEETAPIQWVCFGVGALNDAVLPTAAIATAERYQVPEIACRLAIPGPEPTWHEQRYAGAYRFDHDLLARPYRSRAVFYRAPEVMLSSAQDYRAGLPGLQEYIWGATLGPEAQIAVNHAPNDSVSPSARPNGWAGNRELPRVRQHRDTLIALHRIGPDDPMGYSHAWFPTTHLDEWLQQGSWTAGRVGDGYVALSTAGGARLVRSGPDALQELRPLGDGTAWVCVVGRAATDGSLQDFVSSLGEPDYTAGDLGPRAAVAPEGRPALELDFDGPFLVDGRIDEPLGNEPGLDGPFVTGDSTRLDYRLDGLSHQVRLEVGEQR